MRSVVVSLVTVVLLAVWTIARVSTSLESGDEPAHLDMPADRSQESPLDVPYESGVAAGSRGDTPTRERSNIEQPEGTRGRIAALEREIESLPENESRRRALEELLETSKAAIDDLMVAGLSFDDAERIVITGNDNYFSCIRDARAAVAPNKLIRVDFENCALIMLQQTGLAEFPTTSH